ncbi:MAG TPA: LysR substrate-binding domain-containing protein [Pelagibacterium sp.]|uniref:LysR substrate-binding domain-containing protein n=1 Tax=Pelagibacterium sp. TaxID=1967288 RepID=UPI002C8C6D1E|nr:LysR substrate-binding domain-containing protein [Pelagibacterium sp.]HWJ87106.1 LysR substrate-binding domain-containing protein [Pelagibacterium sp.]
MAARNHLPSLNLLRGFEAAARHLSFTKAANELNVTQGAISRQIRELEWFFGKPLFIRMTRKIALTREGETFFEQVREALDKIDEATLLMLRRPAHRHIKLNILPTLSTHWLMPRLSLFTRDHPDVEVTLVSSIDPVDLANREADIAIRVGPLPGQAYDKFRPRISLNMVTGWSGIVSDELFPDVLVPVCAPHLLGEKTQISPPELVSLPLIRTTTRPYAWVDWLTSHDLPAASMAYAIEFGHFFMALDAARQGIGVAIVPTVIFANYAHRNDLVIPLDLDYVKNTPSAGTYQMLIAADELRRPEIQSFRTWMRQQAEILMLSSEMVLR